MQQNKFIKNISEAAEYSSDSNIYQKPLKTSLSQITHQGYYFIEINARNG